MNPHAKHLGWAAAALFTVGVVSGWSAPSLLRVAQATDSPVAQNITASATPDAIPPGTAPDYHAIFAHNQAAVVSITTVGETPVAETQQQPFDFGQFFGNDGDNPFGQFFRNMPQQPPSGAEVPTRALGSGFIVNSNGVILTNAHVVNGAKQVTVTLSDHRQYKAHVLGADRTSDIAVLKIDAHDLPTVHLGDSDRLAVGDYVMAIGAPFGLTESATAGIVSAKSRSLPNDGYVSFIQTDAAVNPGNSGGPLFNATGSVVGINSQIYSNSGGYQGVAFAIPINYAEQVESQIVKTGKVEHGRLGVSVQTVDQSLANSFGLSAPGGALVSKVQPDSAAAHAGLTAGDVILKYNGAPVEDAAALSMRVNSTAPGQKATLVVWRHGKTLTMTASVGSTDQQLASADDSPTSAAQTHLGLSVRPLTPDERDQAGLNHGLVVESAQGHAADAGIQQGDVVLAVNGTPVDSVSQLRQAVSNQHGGNVALLIQRGNDRIFVPVDLG
ncbi:MAG TPA: DegQ family serine endoprotease [Steroidobacteraceae bacterium]|jgi:serine protease Do|nr:DegQ family serine endoprotease [Steroidobacteraceae bacterium]